MSDEKEDIIDILDLIGVEDDKTDNTVSTDNTGTTTDTNTQDNSGSTSKVVIPPIGNNAPTSSGTGTDTNNVDISDLLGVGGIFSSSGNPGTGDVEQDLINWLTNGDKLPSDPLSGFLSNSAFKAEFSLYFMLLSSVSRLKTLTEYVKAAEQVLYDPNNILQLDTDEVKSRHETALKAIDNLISHSHKIVYSLKKEKSKNKEDEVDRLKLLLGSLPADKIRELIKYLK